MAINDVVEDLEDQLPQLAVLHQRDGEERVQEGRRQRRRHGLGLEPRGHLREKTRAKLLQQGAPPSNTKINLNTKHLTKHELNSAPPGASQMDPL